MLIMLNTRLKKFYRTLGFARAPQNSIVFGLHVLLRNIYFAFKRKTGEGRRLITGFKRQKNADVVAIRLGGGIGDHINAARYLRDFSNAANCFRFHIYTERKSIMEWLLSSCPDIEAEIYSRDFWELTKADYALALNVTQTVSVEKNYLKILELKRNQNLYNVVKNILDNTRPYESLIDQQPTTDSHLVNKLVLKGYKRYDICHRFSSLKFQGHYLEIITDSRDYQQYKLNELSYITINTGYDELYTGDRPSAGKLPTKVYPHNEELVGLIKKRFPDIVVVQIGTAGTSIDLESADLNLVGKTSLQSVAHILSKSMLHIDSEGGLVHLMSSLGGKSCVIFGPTNFEFFSYPSNINIGPSYCGNCWWLNPDWMARCARGYDTPKCLSDTAPRDVFGAIESYLDMKLRNIASNLHENF